MFSDHSPRRGLRLVLAVCAVVVLAAMTACAPSRAPITTATQPSTSAASPTVAATTTPSSTAPTAAVQTGTDAAGGAIASTLTITHQSKPAVGGIAKPTDAEAIDALKKVLAKEEDAQVSAATVTASTQDHKGTWWVLYDVTVPSLGDEKAILTFNGKKWEEEIFGMAINNDDLPADVKF